MQFVRAGFKNAARAGVCAGQRICCGLCVLCVVIFSPARIARGPERQMTALAALSRASNQRSPKPLAGAPQAGRRGQLNRTREHHGSRRYPDHDRGQPRRRPPAPVTRLGAGRDVPRRVHPAVPRQERPSSRACSTGCVSSLRPLRQRSYETGEGEKRTVYEVDADDVAVPLCGATVKVTKAARSTAGAAKSAGDSTRGRVRPGRLLRHSAFLALQARSRAGAFPDRFGSITRECRRYALPS